MRSLVLTGLLAGLGSLLSLATPTPAQACGGTFCDAGPNVMDPEAMPVDQTGETIVFAIDETHVEAHIQINYDPDSGAERFAWLIPIMGQNPEFSASSQQLFLNLQNATVPSYGYTNSREACSGGGGFGGDGGGGWDECGGSGSGAGTSAAGGDEGTPGDDGETTGGGTEIVGKAAVGAFDIVVLQSETAEDLMTWLGDNEFFQDELATPILQEYVDEGALFAAIRLSNAAEIGEIHPLTLRYEGSEPCIPIRLTRIAAQDDMDIRAFFLGSGRFYPSNYRHIELNPLMIDWVDLASNYKDVVTMAIDTPLVDGHGFVTEYAGSTLDVPRTDLQDMRWDSEAFVEATALDAPSLLGEQGLLLCAANQCDDGHPLIGGLLDRYLPVPEGLSRGLYYSCIECYEDEIDLEAWNGAEFATDLLERIIEPGQHAHQLLLDNTYVTRMYTTISPHEMTVDPMFHLEAEIDELVDDTDVTATRYFSCGGATEMQGVPGGRTVRLASFDAWPAIAPSEMPWVERITEHMPGVAPVELQNNTELIDTLLATWNSGASPFSASCHDHGPGAEDDKGSGCGCRSDEQGGGMGWALIVLALGIGGWSRRRRR